MTSDELLRAYVRARVATDPADQRAERRYHARPAATADLADPVRADLRALRLPVDGGGTRRLEEVNS